MSYINYGNSKIQKSGAFLSRGGRYFTSVKRISEYLSTGIGDRVILVLRHSVRPDDNWDSGVKLTDLGVEFAKLAGGALKTLPGEIEYYSTNLTRTRETAYYISLGRGDDKLRSPDDVRTDWPVSDFIKDYGKYNYYSGRDYYWTWMDYMYKDYYLDAFWQIADCTNTFCSDCVRKDTIKYNVVIASDQNIIPLVVQLTNKGFDFRNTIRKDDHEYRQWLNYLSGIAIVFDKGAVISAIPVTGLPTGFYVWY